MGNNTEKKIKVLLGILSTDIHTRASLVIAQALRDAGMEVVFLGFGLTPEMIVNAAEEEDPDVIGLSTHEGFHLQLFPKVISKLAEKKMDIPVVAGGSIQEKDKPFLESIGVTGNFGPGTPLNTVIDHIKSVSRKK